MNREHDERVYQDIQGKLGVFSYLAGILQILFILLGIISVASSLAVATFSDELQENNLLKPGAYTATISATLITAFGLNRKASDARTAWRILRVAKLRYDVYLSEIDELIDHYAEAEDTVGHVVFNPPKQEAHTLKAENNALRETISKLERNLEELQEQPESNEDKQPESNEVNT